MAERMLYRPAEVGEAIGVSRARAYELIAAGVIPSIRIGSSIRVPVDSLREWIREQLVEQGTATREER
jgi:excisionase family DNA binding protein